MRTAIKGFEKTILVIIFTTFMGQIYLQPFDSDFRLTLAVVVISVAFLIFKDIEPLLTINVVGLLMLLVRSGVYAFEKHLSLTKSLDVYWPVLIFYFFYGVLFVVLDVRQASKQPFLLIISLWFCDSIPNILEFIVRRGWQIHPIENAIYTIVGIGLIRACLTTFLFYASQYYVDVVKARRQRQTFVESVVFMASLKTELFFLKKSKNNIEEAMRKSYSIYERMENSDLKERLLEVTKDIHEIKKDYTRVTAGIERHLSPSGENPLTDSTPYQMPIREIFEIVIDTNKKVADRLEKKVKFNARCEFEGSTVDFYALVSVLNNLVINAIEAIVFEGSVSLYCYKDKNQVRIDVIDSAGLLELNLSDVVFEPGFTTKFNEESGIMNSGLGLTHVKQIIDDVFMGTIRPSVDQNKMTKFEIFLPITNSLK